MKRLSITVLVAISTMAGCLPSSKSDTAATTSTLATTPDTAEVVDPSTTAPTSVVAATEVPDETTSGVAADYPFDAEAAKAAAAAVDPTLDEEGITLVIEVGQQACQAADDASFASLYTQFTSAPTFDVMQSAINAGCPDRVSKLIQPGSEPTPADEAAVRDYVLTSDPESTEEDVTDSFDLANEFCQLDDARFIESWGLFGDQDGADWARGLIRAACPDRAPTSD